MKKRLLLLAALAWPAAVTAQTPGPAPGAQAQLERGRQLAAQTCAACHGADGNSTAPVNPNLAGQHADYITRQLTHFKAGIRVSPVMQGMAATLSDADMRALAVYYAQQKQKAGAARDAALVGVGQSMWRGGDTSSGIPACSACHSPTGAGMPGNYPRLGGQYADYTYAQLKAFKAGERGRDKAGKDTNGFVMVAIAKLMSDAQMKAVAEYAAGLH